MPTEPSLQSDRNTRSLPAIHGLRGIACLIVLVFHALAENKPEWIDYLSGTARLGVWLFFVLSAFLLTTRLLETGTGGRRLLDYAVARFLRIVPLFVLAVALYYSVGLIGLASLKDVAAALTLQGYYGHLWTVPVELEFYLLLPVIVICAEAVFRRSVPAGFTSLLFSVVAAAFLFRPAYPDQIFFWNYLACFGWGVLAAFICRYAPLHSDRTNSLLIVLGFSLVICATLILKSGWLEPPRDAISAKYSMYGAFWALAVVGAYGSSKGVSRVLSWKPLALFGLTIYSTYLFHWFPMHYLARRMEWWAVPASIMASILLGVIGYRMAEIPLHGLRRSISLRKQTMSEAPSRP